MALGVGSLGRGRKASPSVSFFNKSSMTQHPLLRWLVAGIAVAFVLPVLFIAARAWQFWSSDGLAQALGPTVRSLSLAATVSMTAAVIGTVLGWLVVRSDLPGARLLMALLPLPLVLPSFVGAAAYLGALAPGGVLRPVAELLMGDERSFRLEGFWAAWFVLTLFTYPYVLLPVIARAHALRSSLRENARLLGRSQVQTFFAITLRQLQPAIVSGTLLVFLYCLSEFGAVQLLRYDTLTRVVYSSLLRDQSVSFVSALVLMCLAIAVVIIERRVRPSSGPDSRAELQGTSQVHLKRWRPVAAAGAWSVVLLALIVPIVSLLTWAWRGLVGQRLDLGRLLEPVVNTSLAGVVTAVCAVGIMVPVATLSIRARSRLSDLCSGAVLAGFAIPGVVLALSMVFWTLKTPGFRWLYQSFPALIAVYVVHFGAQALGAAETSVRSVPLNLRESAVVLEPNWFHRYRRVQFPLMRPGLVSGAGLVLLSTVKELPATLLLAPTGFDTLATRIWSSYSEGFSADTGVASLTLVIVSGLLTWWFVIRPLGRVGSTR